MPQDFKKYDVERASSNSKLKTQNSKLKGQALLELAIFGSLLIMLLGVLINYGLRYNSQQQVMQQTFRKALASAANSPLDNQPYSTTNVLLTDRHIPDPNNPFGIGSSMPSISQAGVTRNYQLNVTPDNEDELPVMNIEINGQSFSFKTAGFRKDPMPLESLARYEEVYGANNINKNKYPGTECLEWGDPIIDPSGDEIPNCVREVKNVQIMDSCSGEVISYEGCLQQARMIVDPKVFEKECERGKQPGERKDCQAISQQEMAHPWYVKGYYRENNKYVFPVLEQLFAFAGGGKKNMGLQSDYTKQTKFTNTSLRKQETPSDITTTDNINWQDETKRTIRYRTYGDESGNTAPPQEVTSSVSQNKTYEWKTSW